MLDVHAPNHCTRKSRYVNADSIRVTRADAERAGRSRAPREERRERAWGLGSGRGGHVVPFILRGLTVRDRVSLYFRR